MSTRNVGRGVPVAPRNIVDDSVDFRPTTYVHHTKSSVCGTRTSATRPAPAVTGSRAQVSLTTPRVAAVVPSPPPTYISHETISQVVSMPREFLLRIDAKLVAEHELRERNRDISMRRELRSVQRSAEATTKAADMQRRVERRASARVNRMLHKEEVELRVQQ